MNRRIQILILSLVFITSHIIAQPKCHITHYGVTDGLPQRTVMSIIQDEKSFMWFGTWDGLCRFDGYNFKTYKPTEEDNIFMRSNRINKIQKDSLGYLWIQTYDNEVHRFDPHKGKYITSFQANDKPFLAREVLIMRSGKVWLTSENTGTICIPDAGSTYKHYSTANGVLPGNCIRSVYEDNNRNTWILTDSGITRINEEDNGKVNHTSFFSADKNKASFFSTYETDTEVWFGADRGRIICYSKAAGKFEAFNTGTSSDIISIKKVYDNLLVILTSKEGFLICDSHKSTIHRYNKATLKNLPTDEMRSCYIDRYHNIWFELSYPGVTRFNVIKGELKHYISSASQEIDFLDPTHFAIAEDKNGNVWVHPRAGGFSYYDKATDTLLPFYNDPYVPNWQFSHLLHCLFVDQQDNIWISTRSDGIEKITLNSGSFKINNFKEEPRLLSSEIRAIFEDRHKNLWVGSKEGTILVFNARREFKGYLSTRGSISKAETPLRIMAYTFIEDIQGNLWIGSKGEGLFVLDGLTNKPDVYRIKQYRANSLDPYSLSHNTIHSLHQDNDGRIWIGTFGGGLNLFDRERDRFINHTNLLKGYPIETGYRIRTINSVDDILFVGTTLGLIVCQMNDASVEQAKYSVYTKSYKNEDGLKSNNIYHVYVTKNNEVYIATQGGGLSHVRDLNHSNGTPVKFETYDLSTSFPFDVVLSIVEDRENRLWVVGEGSLARFDPVERTSEVFNEASSVIGNSFFSDSFPVLVENGEIVLGLTNGILSFTPEDIRKDSYSPYIAFINFNTSGENSRFKNGLDDKAEIALKHNSNTFSIEYAALDFSRPENISYAYKLEGLENEWIYNQNQRMVNYTNLPPGDYTFKVKSTNSNGQWSNNEHSLVIQIKPSFWQTQWAYALYLILFILTLIAILRSLFIFYRMKDRVKLEQEQTEMKTRFYTNISHEIRTPLTLIVSPIEDIIEKDEVSPDVKPRLQLVLKNANRMLNMVNQILDFRKIQKQKLQLKETSLGILVTELFKNFTSAAENKGIHLSINNQMGVEKLWVDTDSIEKLLYNLLSNALKHTPSGKKVEINLFRKDSGYALQIKDEGKGISKEMQEKLFIRFASFNTNRNNPSTGIGLSIVKEIADKHHAKVTVESAVNKGSVFTVYFQSGLTHFSEDENVEIISSNAVVQKKEDESFSSPTHSDNETSTEENPPLSILIVDDDDDLRGFIKSILSPMYQVYDAANGKQGYELTTQHLPDFILSDIMMPEMDGITFLKAIRNNTDTSHIPFILLTAKTSIYDELEGVTSGADDYITKPFHAKLLKAKIENIIRQRQRFSFHLANQTTTGLAGSTDHDTPDTRSYMSPKDEEFIRNIIAIIDENMDNSEFTIEDLVAETAFGRKVFYIKIKSLTGLAPIEFVRDIRIKKAGQLLQSGDYMVKEAAYMVGFSDTKYFSRCFKQVYGMTPSEYQNKKE